MRVLSSLGSHFRVQTRQVIFRPLSASTIARSVCPTNADQTINMSIARVDQARYGEQLSAKVERVKVKFADFSMPDLEVLESQSEHYRMRQVPLLFVSLVPNGRFLRCTLKWMLYSYQQG